MELEPSQKRRLYSALAMENKTLKDWLVEQVDAYLAQASDNSSDKGGHA